MTKAGAVTYGQSRMDRARLDTWCERAIIGLVLATLVLGPLATGAVRGEDFAILGGCTLLASALWVVRAWLKPGLRIQWPPIGWTVVGFVAYAILRYPQAGVEYVARQELLRILVYGWLFFIVLNNLHRQETTQLLLGVLLTLGTLIAMYAIYQFLTSSLYVWHFRQPAQYLGRASGTYICPNHLAGLLELLLPIALALMFMSRSSAVAKVLYGYAALVMLVGLGTTISRGGWVATGVALLVFFGNLLRQRNYRRLVVLTIVVLGVGSGFYVLRTREVHKRLQLMLPGRDQDIRVRPWLWEPAVRMWWDHPWLGVGPGQFDVRFPAYRPSLVQSRPLWVHNDYLNALADWGVVGAGLIAAFLACLTVGVVKTLKYVHRATNDLVAKQSDRTATVLGIAVGLIALLLHSVVDFNMQIPANAILAFVLMAILTSHLRFATDRYWVTLRWLGRLTLTGLGVASLLYLAPQFARRYREATWLTRAAAPKTEAEQITLFLAAAKLEPMNAETADKLGEIFRLRSWEGGDNWQPQIEAAMRWFQRSMALNPYETYPVARYGMCLDWLKRPAEAERYFERALQMDPNNHYVVMLRGWHELQKEDYRAAKAWFEKSWKIKPFDNEFAVKYLAIAEARIAAGAPP